MKNIRFTHLQHFKFMRFVGHVSPAGIRSFHRLNIEEILLVAMQYQYLAFYLIKPSFINIRNFFATVMSQSFIICDKSHQDNEIAVKKTGFLNHYRVQ